MRVYCEAIGIDLKLDRHLFIFTSHGVNSVRLEETLGRRIPKKSWFSGAATRDTWLFLCFSVQHEIRVPAPLSKLTYTRKYDRHRIVSNRCVLFCTQRQPLVNLMTIYNLR